MKFKIAERSNWIETAEKYIILELSRDEALNLLKDIEQVRMASDNGWLDVFTTTLQDILDQSE